MNKTTPTRLALALAVLLPTLARAEGEVVVELVVPKNVEGPTIEYPGFITRAIENPVADIAPYDPLPECFVFLEGGPAGADATNPPKDAVVWAVGATSFAIPVLPVVVGTLVQLENASTVEHLLKADDPALIPGTPLNPKSTRQVTMTKQGHVRVTSQDNPHLEGRIVTLPSRYFALVGSSRTAGVNGEAAFTGIPAGSWTAKVWYRDGWLSVTAKVEVAEGAKSAAKVRIELPAKLATTDTAKAK